MNRIENFWDGINSSEPNPTHDWTELGHRHIRFDFYHVKERPAANVVWSLGEESFLHELDSVLDSQVRMPWVAISNY